MAIQVTDNWMTVMNWIASPSSNKPDPAVVAAGMNEFIQSIQLKNNHLDQRMYDALSQNVQR